MPEEINRSPYVKIHGVDSPSTLETAGKQLGTYYLAQNPNEYEIQRSNNFELVITFPATMNLVRAGLTDVSDRQNGVFAADRAQEVLRLSVNETFVPHFNLNTLSIRRGNNEFKFAGVPTFNNGSATFHDYIGADVLEILMAWQNKAYNVRTEKVGLARDYKTDASLLIYTPDYQLVRTWKYNGLWVSNVSENNFSNDNNNVHDVTAEFVYDRAYIDTSEIV